jgi:hypothetical protein
MTQNNKRAGDEYKERLNAELARAEANYADAARRLPKEVAAGTLTKEAMEATVSSRLKIIYRLFRELHLPRPGPHQLAELVQRHAATEAGQPRQPLIPQP